MAAQGPGAGGYATGYLEGLARTFERVEVTDGNGAPFPLDDGIARAVEMIVAVAAGGKALLIGNGGSAAIVSHMHNDLCKSVGVRAMVFNEAPLLTAMANDDGYHTVFHRPIDLWVDAGDLLIAVSSSGESENIVKAASVAVEKGCRVLTFSGFKPANRLRQVGHLNIYVPDHTYGYVEMTHSVVGHCITDCAAAKTKAASRP
jgi:D-sedoheptulose 7-phosphate isomerase